ncbi:MAG: hypothetical protein K2L70_03625 [Clostridia bacterium]|nr:hypothetical protein [Clostridia bacterium]
MRKKKGPCKADEWEDALKGALSCVKSEYLKCGKLKKCDYKTLLRRIDECVISNLNAALKLFDESIEEFTETLYRLKVLNDTVHNVCFFHHLDFIKKSDKEDIDRRVKSAIANFLSQIEMSVDNENADLIYQMKMLKRAAGV